VLRTPARASAFGACPSVVGPQDRGKARRSGGWGQNRPCLALARVACAAAEQSGADRANLLPGTPRGSSGPARASRLTVEYAMPGDRDVVTTIPIADRDLAKAFDADSDGTVIKLRDGPHPR
jgi:hypothetical protein